MALWRSGYAAVCKTVYTGSIPVGASNLSKQMRQFFRKSHDFGSIISLSPNGGIGIRVRLKIEWRNPYGFKSHFGHQQIFPKYLTLCHISVKLKIACELSSVVQSASLPRKRSRVRVSQLAPYEIILFTPSFGRIFSLYIN